MSNAPATSRRPLDLLPLYKALFLVAVAGFREKQRFSHRLDPHRAVQPIHGAAGQRSHDDMHCPSGSRAMQRSKRTSSDDPWKWLRDHRAALDFDAVLLARRVDFRAMAANDL